MSVQFRGFHEVLVRSTGRWAPDPTDNMGSEDVLRNDGLNDGLLIEDSIDL